MRLHRTALARTVLTLAATSAVAVAGAVPLEALTAAPAGATTTITGPDVSSYQHPAGAAINWAAVKRDGRAFAIVKATESTWYVNPYFRADYSGIRKAGLVRGSYHFARPALPVWRSATTQAKFYVGKIGTTLTNATLPPVLDLEVDGGLTRGQLVTWAQDFLIAVHRLTGRTPMLYTFPWFWTVALGDPTALARYPLWMASYSSGVGSGAVLWQYTSAAQVSGIHGGVDMSRLVAPTTTWTALASGKANPWTKAAPAAPVAVHATATTAAATVTWLPGDTGSAPVGAYRVTAHPGGAHVWVGGATTSAHVPGLTNGVAYTFTVKATNAVGLGTASAPTTPVTPLVPTTLSVTSKPVFSGATSATVSAVLRRADTGAAVPNVLVSVASRPAGGATWTALGRLTTDAAGAVTQTFTPAPTQNLQVRFRYAAPAGWRPAAAIATVLVRPKVTAVLSSTTVRANHAVWLTGTVSPALAGLTVYRQGYYSGAWHTWATTTLPTSGKYAFRIVPTVRTTDVYRVVVAAGGGRARGISKTLSLTVR